MPKLRPARGFTLIEVMVAMAVLLVGALGLIGLANIGNVMNGDGRRMTRATAIAQDLVSNIDLWQYTDPRLVNTVTANDADIGDAAMDFECKPDPGATCTPATPDHAEADLTAGGNPWLGLPQAALAAGGFERFWNISQADDWNANGVPDARRIAVIVRWPQGSGFRRIVLYTVKVNPADQQ